MKIQINEEEYFKNWDEETLANLTPEQKEEIIKWFLNKQLALHRDGWKCKNEYCETGVNSLELEERRPKVSVHHVIPRIDFKENPTLPKRLGYECHDLENLATLCRTCHRGYEKALLAICIKGQEYKLDRPTSFDFKKIIKEGKELRRRLKALGTYGWNKISEADRIALILLLMKWLNTAWYDLAETEE